MKFDTAINAISDNEIKIFGKLGPIVKKYIRLIKKTKNFAIILHHYLNNN